MTKQPGLDNRHRDKNGEIRKKNSNTTIDSLREIYGQGFASGYSGHATLANLLHRENGASLSAYLKKNNHQ